MQTHLVPKIMHQNLAFILRQFNDSQNSFIVLVPDALLDQTPPPEQAFFQIATANGRNQASFQNSR